MPRHKIKLIHECVSASLRQSVCESVLKYFLSHPVKEVSCQIEPELVKVDAKERNFTLRHIHAAARWSVSAYASYKVQLEME